MLVALRSSSRMLVSRLRLLLRQLLAITIITMTTATLMAMVMVTADTQCPEHIHRLKSDQCRTIPAPDPPGVTANHHTQCYP
jgi:hypothetical protein